MALLERGQELAAIDEFLTAGGVLVVEGAAGIGKTSLLGVTCQLAGGFGYEVLRARGSGLESEFAFGVVRQLFERRMATADRNESEQLLEGLAHAGPRTPSSPTCGSLVGTGRWESPFVSLG